jgi:hypothetical protein
MTIEPTRDIDASGLRRPGSMTLAISMAASLVSGALLAPLPAAAQTSASTTTAPAAKKASATAHAAPKAPVNPNLVNAAPDAGRYAHVTFADANEVIAPPAPGVKAAPNGGRMPSAMPRASAGGDDCSPHGGRMGIVLQSMGR